MEKLLAGIHHFKSSVFRSQSELFTRLSQGQSPDALLITCSDSRIVPNLITQTAPGDLFILRNAGNIVPPYCASGGGEAATIEFAVAALGVEDVIVCGHTLCGAMKGLLDPSKLTDLPLVLRWLELAEATRRIVVQKYSQHAPEELLQIAIEENVLVQLENLRTHPAIAAALAQDRLRLHGWVYEIETGQVFAYDGETEQFEPISTGAPKVPPPADRLSPSRAI